MRLMKLSFLVWMLVSIVAVQAQDVTDTQCRALTSAATVSLLNECDEQAIQTACVGNVPVTLETDADDLTFEQAGDVVALADVQSLTLGASDVVNGAWGVVRMLPRHNFSDEVLTMWVSGDLTLTNQGDADADMPTVVTTVNTDLGVNVRQSPSEGATIVAQQYTGDTVRVLGLSADGVWARVALTDGVRGWAVASGFDATHFDQLNVINTQTPPDYGAMQAFTIERNEPETSCATLPPSGVLVQTTDTVQAPAQLQVNAQTVWVAPTSTVFFSTIANDLFFVAVVEGGAQVVDADVQLEAGQSFTLLADGSSLVTTYTVDVYNTLARLPLESLPRPTYAALDFTALKQPARDGVNPLDGLGMNDTCTIASVIAAANLRDIPSPAGRVRNVMQIGESAFPDARQQGLDGVLWWRLAEDVWVSSNAVGALGDCGTLPVITP